MISSSYQAITQKRRCFSLMLFYSAASSFFVHLTVSADEVEQENKKRVSHNILVLLLFLYLSNRKLQLFIGKLQCCTLYNFYLQILQDILLSFAVVVISALSPSPSSPYRLVFFFLFYFSISSRSLASSWKLICLSVTFFTLNLFTSSAYSQKSHLSHSLALVFLNTQLHWSDTLWNIWWPFPFTYLHTVINFQWTKSNLNQSGICSKELQGKCHSAQPV